MAERTGSPRVAKVPTTKPPARGARARAYAAPPQRARYGLAVPEPTKYSALGELDDLDSLPALDGDDDAPMPVPDDEIDDDPADAATDTLDDGTGEDELGEEDFGEDEAPALGDDSEGMAGEVPEVDSLDGDGAPIAAGDDAPGIVADDVLVDALEGTIVGTDAGEEGLGEEPGDQLRAEDLPPLDAGDDEEGAEEGFFEGIGGPPGDAWNDSAWELTFFHRVAEPVTAIVAMNGGAVFAAGGLNFISDRGLVRPLAAAGTFGTIAGLAASATYIEAIMADGAVFRSADEGRSFAVLDERREARLPASFALPSGQTFRAEFDSDAGRTVLRAGDQIVADVTRDSDGDAEAFAVVSMCVDAVAVWVALRTGVARYRTR